MKRTIFGFFLLCLFSLTNAFAQSNTHTFALSLGNAFKNHADMPKATGLQSLATTYGGEDVSNQPLPTLKAIA